MLFKLLIIILKEGQPITAHKAKAQIPPHNANAICAFAYLQTVISNYLK
jgi:hypothetical protein